MLFMVLPVLFVRKMYVCKTCYCMRHRWGIGHAVRYDCRRKVDRPRGECHIKVCTTPDSEGGKTIYNKCKKKKNKKQAVTP